MDKFLENQNLSKLTVIENMNNLICNKEIESIFPKKTPNGFTSEFFQTFMDEIKLIFTNSSRE